MLLALGADRLGPLDNTPDTATPPERHGVGVRERVPTAVYLSAADARSRTAQTLDLPYAG